MFGVVVMAAPFSFENGQPACPSVHCWLAEIRPRQVQRVKGQGPLRGGKAALDALNLPGQTADKPRMNISPRGADVSDGDSGSPGP